MKRKMSTKRYMRRRRRTHRRIKMRGGNQIVSGVPLNTEQLSQAPPKGAALNFDISRYLL